MNPPHAKTRSASILSSVLTAALSLVAFATPRSALAADEPPPPANGPPATTASPAPFGTHGTLVIGSDANLAIQGQETSGFLASLTVTVQPAVDYFVIDHLSLGLEAQLSTDHTSSTSGNQTSVTLGVGGRVGYDVPLSDHFSVWPRAFVWVGHTSTNATGVAPGSEVPSSFGATDLWGDAFVPVLYHPVPHFFVGFGPFVDHLLAPSTDAETFYGGKFTIGGWL